LERDNLWAPWRIGYITAASKTIEGCFLCHGQAHEDQDDETLLLWRSVHCMVVMNRYPYNNGHVLIAPKRHFADLSDATDEEMLDMMQQVRDIQACLTQTINPDGFNTGINTGRCAGAGVPGHLHIHVVPRWNGDTNFMSVCSDTEVISQSMNELLILLRQAQQS
jgi:ATP adenylyltransferase